MSSASGSEIIEVSTQRTFYKTSLTSSSSVESLMVHGSSLPPVVNPKMALYKQGLDDAGSGEICIEYVPMSDSTILRHVYYAYPGLKDPGIQEALLDPEAVKTYPLDGQELYLDLCEQMKLAPVRSFLRGLLGEIIDLKYYGVNPNGIRAMCMALTYNSYVKRLDLTSNFLNEDACYHIGQLLKDSTALQEVILSGCRIRADGVRKLVAALATRKLDLLDLSRNELGDIGFEYLAQQLLKGAIIKRLNLSYNQLGPASASAFAAATEGNKTITHLDVSWNRMSTLKEVNEFIEALSDSKVLVELSMSWNYVKVSIVLKKLLAVPNLRILDLSHNRLSKLAANAIANTLPKAGNLHTLDLSFNPLSASDAFKIVNILRNKTIKLVNLFMANIEVDRKFVEELKEVTALSYRKKCTITYGSVKHDYVLSTPDMREILLKRIDFITGRASKMSHLDIAIYFLEKLKSMENMQPREFMRDMKAAGTPVDEDLINGLADMFPGPRLGKGEKTMDLIGVVEIIHRLWPDKKPPPTPVLHPELEQVNAKTAKGKKKR